MSLSLEDLLKKERRLYGCLDSWMASTTMEDTDIESLGLEYEKCLTDILNYTSTNSSELKQKFAFVFDVIKRGYEDHALLALMKASLSADVDALKANPNFE